MHYDTQNTFAKYPVSVNCDFMMTASEKNFAFNAVKCNFVIDLLYNDTVSRDIETLKKIIENHKNKRYGFAITTEKQYHQTKYVRIITL